MKIEELLVNFNLKKDQLNNSAYYLDTEIKDLYSRVKILKSEYSFIILKDILAIDYLNYSKKEGLNKRFQLIYTLENLEEKIILHLVTPLDLNDEVESLNSIYANANNLEDEVFDLMGITFNQKNLKKILLQDYTGGSPLRKNYNKNDEKEIKKKVKGRDFFLGLQDNPFSYVEIMNPLKNKVGNYFEGVFLLEDDHIQDLKINIGYCHRGIEKQMEELNYSSLFFYLQKLDPQNSISISLLMVRMFEKIMGLNIPKDEKKMRVVLLEWERILSHLQYLINLFEELGGESYSELYLKEKDKIEQLLIDLMGEKENFINFSPGRTALSFSIERLSEILGFFYKSKENLKKTSGYLVRNPLLTKWKNEGIIDFNKCIEFAINGPTLRAAGINYDIRTGPMTEEYDDLTLKVPLGNDGSLYDRFLVRLEEIFISIDMITNILENLSCNDTHLLKLNQKSETIKRQEVKNFSQALDISKEELEKNYRIPEGHYFSSLEGANGEIWVHLISDGGLKPYRIKIGSGHYSLLEGLKFCSKKRPLDFFPLYLKSLDINFSLLER